jgi:hypothetical protein
MGQRLLRKFAILCFASLAAMMAPLQVSAATVPLDVQHLLTPNYGGGLSVFNLYWDSSWDTDHPHALSSTIDAATAALFSSAYPASLAQYNVPPALGFRGSAQAVGLCGGNPGSMTNTPSLLLFMACEEATPGDGVPFAIAPPFSTTATIYNLILPVGTNISDTITNPFNGQVLFRNGSCHSGVIPVGGGATYGAYHALVPGIPLPLIPFRTIFFTIIPADCAKDSSGALSIPQLMTLISHEVVETATDPVPLLYWINLANSGTTGGLFSALISGEVADECEGTFGSVPIVAGGIPMTVNAYWSNAVHACVVGPFRVVNTTFRETGVPGSLATVTVGGVSRSLSPFGSLVEPELEGTVFAFPSEIDGAAGVRYIRDTCSSVATGVVTFPAGNTTADASETESCSYHKEVRVTFDEAGIPAGTAWQVTVNGVAHSGPFADWFQSGASLTFAYQSPVAALIPGTRYVVTGTNFTSPLSPANPASVIATYQTQHLLTVSTSGLGASFTHVFNTGTLLGSANDFTPLHVWLPSGTPISLAVDSPVTGAGGAQLIFQGFTPTPPATLTAPLNTVAVYLSIGQMISNALADGGIHGPGAAGIANSLTHQISNAQASIARNDLRAAMGEIKAFVSHVDAQSGKKINLGTATMLELAALSLFHDVLCKAQAQGQVSPTQASAQYAWYAAQVTRLGGTPLPPC